MKSIRMMTSASDYSTDFFMVQSYHIVHEPISYTNRVGRLYILLINNENTYLCLFHKSVMINREKTKFITLKQFLPDAPVPFEDSVLVDSYELDCSKLNRITTITKAKHNSFIDKERFYTTFEGCDVNPKLRSKRKYLTQPANEGDDPLQHFIKTHVDFSYKESIRSFIQSRYVKPIKIRNDNVIYIPKEASCSFIKYGSSFLVKHLIERVSVFVVATNSPHTEIELRKVCMMSKFSYSSVFHNNMSYATEYAKGLVISEGNRSILVSKNDEIIGIYNSHKRLGKALKKKDIQLYHTNRPSIQRRFAIKWNKCIPLERLRHLKRILESTKSKFILKHKFYQKKGVTYMNKKKMKTNQNLTVNIHDFSNFYAATIASHCSDPGMRNVFSRLIDSRRIIPKLKHTITTLFGMSKRFNTTMFYRTLNESVYSMYKTYKLNKSNVFAMCKDSFFSYSNKVDLKISGYILKKDHVLNHFKMKNINTYVGIDINTNDVVIKGLQLPPFTAVTKILSALYREITENGNSLDLSNIIQNKSNLCESDFYIHTNTKLKSSDYFYFGLDEVSDFLYCCNNNTERDICPVSASEPTLNIRSKRVLGKIDVNNYANQILLAVIRFAKAFNLLDIINENVICETDLFLKKFIQYNIFERHKQSNLPGFKVHECQLNWLTTLDSQKPTL